MAARAEFSWGVRKQKHVDENVLFGKEQLWREKRMLVRTDRKEVGMRVMASFKMHKYWDCLEKRPEASRYCVNEKVGGNLQH